MAPAAILVTAAPCCIGVAKSNRHRRATPARHCGEGYHQDPVTGISPAFKTGQISWGLDASGGAARDGGREMTDVERKHLAEADRHIAKWRARITRQQKRIRQLTLIGQSTLWARDMLGAMEASLRAFERHRERIVSALDAG